MWFQKSDMHDISHVITSRGNYVLDVPDCVFMPGKDIACKLILAIYLHHKYSIVSFYVVRTKRLIYGTVFEMIFKDILLEKFL